MRGRPLVGLWLVIGIVFFVWVLTRFWRGFGLFGLFGWIVPLAVVLIVLGVARVVTIRSGTPGTAGWRPEPRNVTPAEPTMIEGVSSLPPDGSLEAKLRALDRLRADGIVTEAEYQAKRAQLIADF